MRGCGGGLRRSVCWPHVACMLRGCVLLGCVLTVTMEITVDGEGTRIVSDGADGVVQCVDRGSIHFLRWA